LKVKSIKKEIKHMARTEKAAKGNDAWETRKLGADEGFAKPSDLADSLALDEALELQMISIRLPKQLLGQLKLIAHFNAVGYQPLMRDVLARFARNEILNVLREQAERAELENRMEQARAKASAKAEHKKAA
jgi:hypothetical protein